MRHLSLTHYLDLFTRNYHVLKLMWIPRLTGEDATEIFFDDTEILVINKRRNFLAQNITKTQRQFKRRRMETNNKEAPLSYYLDLVICNYRSLELMGFSHRTINEAKSFLFDKMSDTSITTETQPTTFQNEPEVAQPYKKQQRTKHYTRGGIPVDQTGSLPSKLHPNPKGIIKITPPSLWRSMNQIHRKWSLATMQLSGTIRSPHRRPQEPLSVLTKMMGMETRTFHCSTTLPCLPLNSLSSDVAQQQMTEPQSKLNRLKLEFNQQTDKLWLSRHQDLNLT